MGIVSFGTPPDQKPIPHGKPLTEIQRRGAERTNKILPRHRKIIDLAIQGWDGKKIAAFMGMTRNGVEIILASEAVQDEIARRQESVERTVDDVTAGSLALARETVAQEAVGAAEKLGELVDNEDPRIALNASKSLLEMAFGKGTQVDEAQAQARTVTMVSVQQLQTINIALKEQGVELMIAEGSLMNRQEFIEGAKPVVSEPATEEAMK